MNILGTTVLKIELLEPKHIHTCSPTASSQCLWEEAGKWALFCGETNRG